MIDTTIKYKHKSYGHYEIVEYKSCSDITIRFSDTGYECKSNSYDIKSLNVKDKLHASVYDLGFMGDGPHKSSFESKVTKPYLNWSAMFKRCYSESFLKSAPQYHGCSVHPTWYDYQVFAEWHEKHFFEEAQLDKDILVPGNRVYGPDTCKYVTRQQNLEAAVSKTYNFIAPDGSVIEVFNLAKYCRDNNLSNSRMNVVANKGGKHQGYSQVGAGDVK